MKSCKRVVTFLVTITLTLALLRSVEAQPSTEMKTFFDSEVPGINLQVNATAETQPTEYINVTLSLTTQTDIYINYLNLSIFGFINGTDRILMANITDSEFPLNNDSRDYNCTFQVPGDVWGVTYGEIVLTYSAKYDIVTVDFERLTCGFTSTNVENVYLQNVEEQLKSLASLYEQLNQTYWDLQQNYTSLQGNLGELQGTRQAVIALAVISALFVATTVYLLIRKPRQSW